MIRNEATERAIERIKAIDWSVNCGEHEGSIVALFQEYLQRSAMWARSLGYAVSLSDDALAQIEKEYMESGPWLMANFRDYVERESWLFVDVATKINPLWGVTSEDVEELNEQFNVGSYVNRMCMYFVAWSAIKNRPEVTKIGLPDPYEPFILMCERGVSGMRQDKAGGGGFELGSLFGVVPVYNLTYYLDKPPYTELDLATLDGLDADAQEYDRRLQDSYAEPGNFHIIFPEKRFRFWSIPATQWPLYEKVFEVLLGYGTTLYFVPEVSATAYGWPPVLSDNIASFGIMEARIEILTGIHYSVTPNAARAGQEEVLPPAYDDDDRGGVVFYVTPEEFETFSQEYPIIQKRQAQDTDGHYQSFKIQNLKEEFAIARFILERFVVSPHLYNYDADRFEDFRSS
jgi:hypothetical protein